MKTMKYPSIRRAVITGVKGVYSGIGNRSNFRTSPPAVAPTNKPLFANPPAIGKGGPIEGPNKIDDPRNKIKDKPPRVLFVDDQAVYRVAMQGMLESLGLETDVASNGKEALNKIRTGEFDLIITDLQMDVMDGIEFIKQKDALENSLFPPHRTRVVVLTSLNRKDAKETLQPLIDNGLIVSYHIKPLSSEDLEIILRLLKLIEPGK